MLVQHRMVLSCFISLMTQGGQCCTEFLRQVNSRTLTKRRGGHESSSTELNVLPSNSLELLSWRCRITRACTEFMRAAWFL
ncbi:hypothetical protein SCHPADRAFT_752534 [Schizopora paradoxa]|uniref:Secreted protein n=1 Tax=Schizopora paradoxa TaxID=27342 RepID=A0A0H2QY65_9AGAM|nr:hypothetical protein SCHPADRAFT_752534 [Schizopora paradoxa]